MNILNFLAVVEHPFALTVFVIAALFAVVIVTCLLFSEHLSRKADDLITTATIWIAIILAVVVLLWGGFIVFFS